MKQYINSIVAYTLVGVVFAGSVKAVTNEDTNDIKTLNAVAVADTVQTDVSEPIATPVPSQTIPSPTATVEATHVSNMKPVAINSVAVVDIEDDENGEDDEFENDSED